MTKTPKDFAKLLSMLFEPNKMHGVSSGPNAPRVVRAYVENMADSPFKMELDKEAGLAVDRQHNLSSRCPVLYGFVPQTYCGDSTGALCAERIGKRHVDGDGDPLDICVLSSTPLPQGGVFVWTKIIGGLRMIDKGQADDKLIAVLVDDLAYGEFNDIKDLPEALLKQLRHFFLTYKDVPGDNPRRRKVQLKGVYGRSEGLEVLRRSVADYKETYGGPDELLGQLKQHLVAEVKQQVVAEMREQVAAEVKQQVLAELTGPTVSDADMERAVTHLVNLLLAECDKLDAKNGSAAAAPKRSRRPAAKKTTKKS